jgi:hypothetical protein
MRDSNLSLDKTKCMWAGRTEKWEKLPAGPKIWAWISIWSNTMVSGQLHVGWESLLNQPIVNFSENQQLDLYFSDPLRHLIGQRPQYIMLRSWLSWPPAKATASIV